MQLMPPPISIQALMLGIAVLLGAGMARALLAPRFPNAVLGLLIGFAPIGWILAFVGTFFLRDPADVSDGPRPFPDWRAMEYLGRVHVAACLFGLVFFAALYKLGPRIGEMALGFKTVLLSGVSFFICLILINTSGFIATLIWAGEGWVVLPMVGYLVFALAGLAICLGILRNQLSGDGPGWLRGSR